MNLTETPNIANIHVPKSSDEIEQFEEHFNEAKKSLCQMMQANSNDKFSMNLLFINNMVLKELGFQNNSSSYKIEADFFRSDNYNGIYYYAELLSATDTQSGLLPYRHTMIGSYQQSVAHIMGKIILFGIDRNHVIPYTYFQ